LKAVYNRGVITENFKKERTNMTHGDLRENDVNLKSFRSKANLEETSAMSPQQEYHNI